MPLIRTEKQKDNLAKFLYDLCKIVLAVAGAAFVFAYYLDGKETEP